MKSRFQFLMMYKILLLLTTVIIVLTIGMVIAARFYLFDTRNQININAKNILSTQTETYLKILVKSVVGSIDPMMDLIKTSALSGAQIAIQSFDNKNSIAPIFKHILDNCDFVESVYMKIYGHNLFFQTKTKNQVEQVNIDIDKSLFFPDPIKFKETNYQKILWTSVHTSPFVFYGDMVIDAVAPIMVDTSMMGYFGVSVSLNNIARELNNHLPLLSSYFFIMDDKYQLLCAPPHGKIDLAPSLENSTNNVIQLDQTKNPELFTVLSNMALGQTYLEKITIQGELKYMSYSPLNAIDWRLGIVVPVSIATAASEELAIIIDNTATSSLYGMLICSIIMLVFVLIVGLFFARRLTSPLHQVAIFAKQIAFGNFSMKFSVRDLNRTDEVGIMTRALKTMNERIREVLNESDRLIMSIKLGKLNIVGKEQSFVGEWRELVMGLNSIIAAFVEPINQTSKALNQMSIGDIPDTICATYNGDFNTIINNLNSLIDSMNESIRIADEISLGNLMVDVIQRSEQDRLMKAFQQMATYLNEMAFVSAAIAQGDIRHEVIPKGKNDILGNAFHELILYFREMTHAATQISTGDLSRHIIPKSHHDMLGRAFVNMTQYLNDLANTATELASGDLTRDIHLKSNQDVLGKAFRSMSYQLSKSIKAIAESEKKYRDMFENSIEGIFQSTREGKIIQANPSMAKIFGYESAKQLVSYIDNVAAQMYVHPKQREKFVTILEQKGSIINFEVECYHRTKKIIWCSISARKITDNKGKTLYYEGNVADITALKEKDVIEKEKKLAEASEKAKSEFLANMSHEIRTPMNAIIGLTTLALKTDLTAKQLDYLHKIDLSAKSLLGIINDILDFSKIEAGKLSIESVMFNLEELVNNISEIHSLAAEKKGVELLIHIHNNVPYILIGDSLRINQILNNLCSNAVKFTQTGQIIIQIQKISSIDSKTVKLKFSVTDTGIGLTQKQIDKLFQPFSQADGSITRQYGGTGLGLQICKSLVELMQGEISVKSEYGKGSTFTFTTVLGIGIHEPEKKYHCPETIKNMRILVVDDNASSCSILKEYLESFSFLADSAETENQAFSMLLDADMSQTPYQLILLDWKMINHDGIEIAEKIKKHPKWLNIKQIIMIASYSQDEIRKKSEQVGIRCILSKPVVPSILFDAILTAFGGFDKENSSNSIEDDLDRIIDFHDIKGAKILVVDDNQINQQIAQELIEHVGLTVHVANNGQECLDILSRSRFDLIFMDVQMPVMDGYTASRHIRDREKKQRMESKPIPIIAMTAHALKGEKEKCLQFGMNDYLSKPIDPEKLNDMLLNWVTPRKHIDCQEYPKPHDKQINHSKKSDITLPERLDGINVQLGLKLTGSNPSFFIKMLISFEKEFNNTHQTLETALKENDLTTINIQSHTIKGPSGNIGAEKLFNLSAQIEQAAKDKQIEQLSSLLELFRQSMDEVLKSISYVKQNFSNQLESTHPPTTTQSNDTINKNKIKPLLIELKNMLQKGDTESVKHVESLSQFFSHSKYQKKLNQLTDLIDDFEFEKAIYLLLKITQDLNISI